MQRKNYKKKIADGVMHIVSYDFEYEGKVFEVKTEVSRMKSKNHSKQLEISYSVKRKVTYAALTWKKPSKRQTIGHRLIVDCEIRYFF